MDDHRQNLHQNDHHHYHHHNGFSELRQLFNNGGGLTSASPPVTSSIPSDLFGFNLVPRSGGGLYGFFGDSSAAAAAGNNNNTMASSSGTSGAASGGGGAAFRGGFFDGGDGGGNGRWPRQETLTLLEIRSRLDHKFKEVNQKGPLWDEISRLMLEENGYQRSGKKCREKFENLYKYYKKTKEGKAGRQDGKHYRFFRQLEAIYGDSNALVSCPETEFISNNNLLNFQYSSTSTHHNIQSVNDIQNGHINSSHHQDFDSSDPDTSPDSNEDVTRCGTRRKRRNWKGKIKEFIDLQMKKLIEKQESWLEKLTKTIEEKEKERMLREEQWRREETAKNEKERSFWMKEKKRIEARDSVLFEALQDLTGNRLKTTSPSPKRIANLDVQGKKTRREEETNNLISRNLSGGYFPRSINEDNNNSMYISNNNNVHGRMSNEGHHVGSSSLSNPSLPFLMGDGDQHNLWENYSLRLSRDEHQ